MSKSAISDRLWGDFIAMYWAPKYLNTQFMFGIETMMNNGKSKRSICHYNFKYNIWK